jgi:hypothetical protein
MQLDAIAMMLVGAAIAVGLGLLLLAKFKTAAGTDATATFNTSIDEGISGLGDITGWFGIIVLMIIGSYLLYSYVSR